MREAVPFVGEQGKILLLDARDESLRELLLSGLEEGGVVVEIALHGLSGSNCIIIAQEEHNGFEVEFLCTRGSQFALHVPISHSLKNLHSL